MINKQLEDLCTLLHLGSMVAVPQKVTGGLLHTMWHVQTTTGSHAIKELNSHIMQKKNVVEAYEKTECIAKMFAQKNIPAITSLQWHNKSVIKIDDTFFITYPWIDGIMLLAPNICLPHAQKIGHLLADMHILNLQVPGVKAEWNLHSNEYYENLIAQACQHRFPCADDLAILKTTIIEWNNCYHNAVPLLRQNLVVSHGDLDPKNVLWTHEYSTHVIDWESARLVNPTQEILNAAFDWSGINSAILDHKIFQTILSEYQRAGGKFQIPMLDATLYGIINNWLNWMAYNIEQCLNGSTTQDSRTKSITQINQTVSILKYFSENSTHLKDQINQVYNYGTNFNR